MQASERDKYDPFIHETNHHFFMNESNLVQSMMARIFSKPSFFGQKIALVILAILVH
jgi:hypothetical protein